MTPINDWPCGAKFATVTMVTHKSKLGIPDPFIMDRICLATEAHEMIQSIQRWNPYATAYVSDVRAWRGAAQ